MRFVVPSGWGTAFCFSRAGGRKSGGVDFNFYPPQALDGLCQWAFREGSVLLQLLAEPGDAAGRIMPSSGLRPSDGTGVFVSSVGVKRRQSCRSSGRPVAGLLREPSRIVPRNHCPDYEGRRIVRSGGLRTMEEVLRDTKGGGPVDRAGKLLRNRGKAAGCCC